MIIITMLAVHRRAIERLKKLSGTARLVLFGSVARGNFSEESDVDIAVYAWDEDTRKKLLNEADRSSWMRDS